MSGRRQVCKGLVWPRRTRKNGLLSLANQYPPFLPPLRSPPTEPPNKNNITELYGRVEPQNKEGENLAPTQKLALNGLSVEKEER